MLAWRSGRSLTDARVAPRVEVGDHRKLIAVDREYASTGGVCISDGWLVIPETRFGLQGHGRQRAQGRSCRHRSGLRRRVGRVGGPWPNKEERPNAERIAPAGEQSVRVIVQEPRRMRTLRMLGLLTAGVEKRLQVTDAYFSRCRSCWRSDGDCT